MQHLFIAFFLGFSLTTLPAFAITAKEFAAFVQSPKDLIVGQTATSYVSAVTECWGAISKLQTFPVNLADFFAFSGKKAEELTKQSERLKSDCSFDIFDYGYPKNNESRLDFVQAIYPKVLDLAGRMREAKLSAMDATIYTWSSVVKQDQSAFLAGRDNLANLLVRQALLPIEWNEMAMQLSVDGSITYASVMLATGNAKCMLAYNQLSSTIGQVEFNEDNISEIEKLFVSGANDIRQGSEIGSQALTKFAGGLPKTAQFRQLNKTADALISSYQTAETKALQFADLSDLIAGIMIKGYSEIINSSHQEIFNQFSRIAADYHELQVAFNENLVEFQSAASKFQ